MTLSGLKPSLSRYLVAVYYLLPVADELCERILARGIEAWCAMPQGGGYAIAFNQGVPR